MANAADPPSRACVPCPPTTSVQRVAPGYPVTFDRSRNSFVVHLEKLTEAQLRERKLTVRVKNGHSWQDLTLELTGFDTVIKRRFAERAREMNRLCDLAADIRKLFSERYNIVFGRYVEDYIAMHAIARSGLASAQIPREVRPPFAQFFSEEVVVPKDFTIYHGSIRDGGERKEGAPNLPVSEGIKVHRFVLVGSSEVLKEKFKNGEISTHIEIEDSSIEAIRMFVKYLYTLSITFASDKEAWEVYRLADRFQVDDLKVLCKTGYCKHVMKLFEPGTMVRPKEFDSSLEKSNVDQMGSLYQQTAARIVAFYKEVSHHMSNEAALQQVEGEDAEEGT